MHTIGSSSLSWVKIGNDIFGRVGVCRSAVGECVDGVFSIFCEIIFDNAFFI